MKYEDLSASLLATLFYPHLDFAETQSRTESGRHIRDLIFYNNRDVDFLDEIFCDFEKATLILEGVLDAGPGLLDNDDLLACLGTLVMITTLQTILGTKRIKHYVAMYQVPPETVEMVKQEVTNLLKEHLNG